MMIKLLKSIICIIICVMTIFTFCSCNAEDSDVNNEGDKIKDNQLTMYIVSKHPIIRLIDEYNNLNGSVGIKVIEFEDNEKLNSKLSSELMARKGPDIILYDSDYNGVSNIEKMMAMDMFADYNNLISNDKSKNAIDFSNYNKTVMETGIYNDKRYFMPISYMPDVLITTKETCDNYEINTSESLAYDTINEILSTFLKKGNKSQNKSVFYYINNQYFSLIDSHINFFNRTNTLDSNDFLSDLEILDKLILPADQKEMSIEDPMDSIIQGNILFASLYQIAGSEPNSMGYIYYYLNSNGQTPLILNNLSDTKNTFSAFINKGFLINKNSERKDEAYEFVKYMLSGDVQCNSEIGLPVNKKAQKKLIEEIDLEIYGIEKDNGYFKFISDYTDILDNINRCVFKNDYFDHSIMSNEVSEYVSGDITKEQFVKEIRSKTQIYLDE